MRRGVHWKVSRIVSKTLGAKTMTTEECQPHLARAWFAEAIGTDGGFTAGDRDHLIWG